MKYISIHDLYNIYLKNTEISIDSRCIVKDSIFVAIKGKNFNGNQFADQAIKLGAGYALVDDASINYKNKDQILFVENSLQSLVELAKLHRDHIKVPVIAITGTSGKTTTKNLISALLSTKYKLLSTKGNLNSNIGLPLTILKIKPEHQIVVLEMGADQIGDIENKCNIAKPSHGLITIIGKAHIISFGSLDNIKRTKAELYKYLLDNKGLAFVNSDDKMLMDLSETIDKKIFYGTNADKINTVYGQVQFVENKIQIKWKASSDNSPNFHSVNTNMTGTYNLLNCLASIAVAKHFKVPDDSINYALSEFKPTDMRSELIHTNKNNTVINDTYNANPLSMSEALKSFSSMQAKQKIAIIGDMLEMGKYAFQEHEKIIQLVQHLNIKTIVFIRRRIL
ncbi:MAG: UDP-N-acetylmuramoyl-tripeptide--D-alanyl-D-alanine ligase [Solitalea-like symbiont of Acarus siro]